MIDLATLFQAASEEHAAASVPDFPVSGKANPEQQAIENKDISGVSGVSGPSEFREHSEKFCETQARARGRAGVRASARVDHMWRGRKPRKPWKSQRRQAITFPDHSH